MPTTNPPIVLVIRDGWGANPHSEHDQFNAIHLARTPVADGLASNWPTTLIRTSGEDVGLPMGTDGPVMGNSEVGHQNLGAGRIVDQELMRITTSIRDGSFFENAALDAAFAHAESTARRVHLVGLVSDGQVHSDIEHLLALIEFARKRGVPRDGLALHAITDGRDTPPNAGVACLERIEKVLEEKNFQPIASVMGRYWAMDRDNRWKRIKRAYDCLVGPPEAKANTAVEVLRTYYANPEAPTLHGDEFVTPTAVVNEEGSCAETRVQDGDAIIFFNFRGDRPRQIARAFVLDDAAFAAVKGGGFDRPRRPKDIRFTGLTRYEEGLPIEVIFEKPAPMVGTLGEAISLAGFTQFRCAETEKFPHVTFFFNDYREDAFKGEERAIVPSPTDIPTYDLKPEMSAYQVRDRVLERLADTDCEALIVVNFANGDMVGHTGVLSATIAACEAVDSCVGAIVQATLDRGGTLLVSADHGNAEAMWDPVNDCPHTAHTNYMVPLHVVGEAWKDAKLRDDGRLADIAPTILQMLDIPQPPEMTGKSILM